MVNITARIKKFGKTYEILVDLDKAVYFRKTGQGSINNILAFEDIFTDVKRAIKAPRAELKSAFETDDIFQISGDIIKNGELLLPADFKKKEREEKRKQIINWIATNTIDPRTGAPHTPSRIESAIEEVGAKVDEHKSVEEQVGPIIQLIQKLVPIKIEKKKVLIKIPSQFTGKAYGIMKEYVLKEEWLGDGSLQCTLEIPTKMQMQVFDKLNSLTHGAVYSKEL